MIPSELLQTSKQALQEKRFADAVKDLEAYLQQSQPTDPDRVQAQVWLAKAYRGNRQTEEAIALSRDLAKAPDPMVQTWAQQFLTAMAATAALQVVAPEAVPALNGSAPVGGNGAIRGSTRTPRPSASPLRRLKSVDQLKNFYQHYLMKDLQALERDRKALMQGVVIAGVVLFLVPWIVWLVMGRGVMSVFFGLMGAILGVVLWTASYQYAVRNHIRNFKMANVVGKIVQGINPDLSYSPYGLPSHDSLRNAYHASQIFQHLPMPDSFQEDDGVVGSIGDTRISFGEIWAEAERQGGSDALELGLDLSSGSQFGIAISAVSLLITLLTTRGGSRNLFQWGGNNGRERYTLFRGILLVANFNKSFEYKTVVLPDMAERLLGGFGKTLQSLNRQHGELVKLEDPEFEKYFAVYSGNQVEARYLLSTNLMERLTRFRKKSGREVSVSFVNQSIYVAIAYDKNLFEPHLFQPMLSFKPIQEYFESLQLIIGIVDDLKLNRRIWGK